jgi:transcriptional regulator with XRE-family HTH domain
MSDRFDGVALGARVRLLRELRDLSLQQLADDAGCTKSHVWEIEQGKAVNPTCNMVWGLARALQVTPAQLLGLSDKMPIASSFSLKIAGMIDRELKRLAPPAEQSSGMPKGGEL